MRVVQSTLGKFHHFDLARQFQRLGVLDTIFTGYPKWKLRRERLPEDKVRTFPWVMTPYMARGRMGLTSPWIDRELCWLATETFDAHVAANLPACDVFIGMSGFALKTSATARRRGAKYICDRGSAHIEFQNRILAEEFSKWGQKFSGVDPRIVRKELAEYAVADIITVPSTFAWESFVAGGVPVAKLRKIPYGVDLGNFQRDGDPNPNCFDVLAVGQVSFRKGFPYLLTAFQQLKHPQKRLTVVGVMQREIEAWLRGKNLEGITFTGALPQSKLPALMSRSHVLALPSVEDGFGLVLGQALACGCPVIASTNTGARDLITDGREGFIVPARNSRGLVEKMEQLCQDRFLYQRMSQAGLQRARELGGWNTYGNQMHHLCRELTGAC